MRSSSRALAHALLASLLVAATSTTEARAQTAVGPPVDVESWHAGDPVPPGYHRLFRARLDLISVGATLFTLPYLASAAVATTGYPSDSTTSSLRSDLWIPGVGPFLQIGSTHTAAGDVFLVLDGLAQLGGIAVFAYGVATPTAVLVPNARAPKPASVSFTPLVFGRAPGAAVVGTF